MTKAKSTPDSDTLSFVVIIKRGLSDTKLQLHKQKKEKPQVVSTG